MTILEILEAHTVKRPWSEASRMRCKCGEVVTAETVPQLYTLHRAHLAEVLDKQMQEREYRAWSNGFHKGRKTENGSHIRTWPKNPYRKETQMGADEKHAATYHGGEYTPATENVEHSYVAYRSSKVDLITGHHEFTRWLDEVRAEAWQEGWEDGRESVNNFQGKFDRNPYKGQSK